METGGRLLPVSSELFCTLCTAAPFSPPSALLLTPLSPSTLSISWQPPAPEDQNGVIQFYTVKVIEEERMIERVENATNNTTVFSLDGLHPYYHYTISVAAVTVAVGPFNTPEIIHMPPAGMFPHRCIPPHYKHNVYWLFFKVPSSPPLGVCARSSSSSSIYILWYPPPAEHKNGEIVSYSVLCIEVNTGGLPSRYTTNTTDLNITGLHPYYIYRCNVAAVTVEEGPFSSSVEATTLEDSNAIFVEMILYCFSQIPNCVSHHKIISP